MKDKLKDYCHLPFWHDEYRRSYGITPRSSGRRSFCVLLALFIAILLVAWLVILPSFPEYVHQWWQQTLR